MIRKYAQTPMPDVEAEVGRRHSAEEELELLAQKIRVCRNCELAEGRNLAVPGEGNPHAAIMFVGEAPRAMEDKTGRPFVGASGKFLDSMLQDIGLRRADVFIANVNRCRPLEREPPGEPANPSAQRATAVSYAGEKAVHWSANLLVNPSIRQPNA